MTNTNNRDLIGMYINLKPTEGSFDVEPVGKIIEVKANGIVILLKVEAYEQLAKLEFVKYGSIYGRCINQGEQKWKFVLTDKVVAVKLTKKYLKRVNIASEPEKFYDYNRPYSSEILSCRY